MKTKYLTLLTAVPALVNCGESTAAPKQQPNIIVIYTDDYQFDGLGLNGNGAVRTPNIDRFFADAVRFTNANVAFSLSSPSRAAMLTGRYGSCNGVLQLDSKLNEGEKTIAQYLKEQGYTTAMSGKWHVKPMPAEVGFDYHSYFFSNGKYYGRTVYDMGVKKDIPEHCDEFALNRSLEFLDNHAKEDEPFFLFHCPQLAHMNHKLVWDAKESTKATYNSSELPVPVNYNDDYNGKPQYLKNIRNRTQAQKYGYGDPEKIQSHTLDYYSVITEMDEFLGKLFTKIDALGLRDNTYIFFMGDNGWMLGDHGFTSKVLPYNVSTRVPFLVMGPNIAKGECDAMVSNIDITPTILDIISVKGAKNIHGESILPILKGRKDDVRDIFIYEGLGNYGGAKPNLTAINKEFRYIVTYEDNNLDKVVFEELYSVANDKDEMTNLIGKDEYNVIIKKFTAEIEQHKKLIEKK